MKRSSFLKAMGLLAVAPLSFFNTFEKDRDLVKILEKYVVNSEKSVGRCLAFGRIIVNKEDEELRKRMATNIFNVKSPLTNDLYEIGILNKQIFMNNLSCIEDHIKKHPTTTFEKYKFKQS